MYVTYAAIRANPDSLSVGPAVSNEIEAFVEPGFERCGLRGIGAPRRWVCGTFGVATCVAMGVVVAGLRTSSEGHTDRDSTHNVVPL